jgi:hypothetical protein
VQGENNLYTMPFEYWNNRRRKLVVDVMEVGNIGGLILKESFKLDDSFRRMDKFGRLFDSVPDALCVVIINSRNKKGRMVRGKISRVIHGKIHNTKSLVKGKISFLEKDLFRTALKKEKFAG